MSRQRRAVSEKQATRVRGALAGRGRGFGGPWPGTRRSSSEAPTKGGRTMRLASKIALGAVALGVMATLGAPAQAQNKELTLCWAAWDPANALVELSKDFTAKSGIQMKF